MVKVSKIIAGLAIVPMLAFSAPVFADSPGQLLGGSNVYVVKNVTQNGAYGSSASVKACGDVIQFSVLLSNTHFGQLTDIVVKANVPTNGGTSNMTAVPASSGTTGTEGSVNVSLGSTQKLSYVAGSTELFDKDSKFVKTLADGIATNGVNVGSLDGSTKEFVNFKAKVSCDTTPPVTPPVTPPTTTTPPSTLPNTGAGSVIALFAVVATAGAVAYNWVMRRQNAR